MNILLVALNAKFIHSSLALLCLKKYAQSMENFITISEYTINHSLDFILSDIYEKNPQILCFSCYIWNISMVIDIIKNCKKVMPHTLIVLGGPEVSYESEKLMQENKEIDFIIRGEGEKTFLELMQSIKHKFMNIDNVYGITYRKCNQVFSSIDRIPMELDEIPFVYEDLSDFEHKIIYYETQRGCPYQCQYCLSSIEKGVRFLSENRVKQDLQFFLKHDVKQVKFVDRTFNCNKKHAMMIWDYLIEHDNEKTNFHMEITADIMDKEMLTLLKKARVGLFQFEIGVQSTNSKTLEAIKRKVDFRILSDVVKEIKKMENIHQHLDLIAGLPFEGYDCFKQSFNDVYALEPEQFQLGFLKLLKGSGLRKNAEKYGIAYREKATYEVLFTKELPFKHVLRLKMIEEMVEQYYNSGKTLYTLSYCILKFPSPFDFYEALGDYWKKQECHKVQHNKMELYTIFYEFAQSNCFLEKDSTIIKQLLKLDMFALESVKTLPNWLEEEKEIWKEKKRNFYNNKNNIEQYFSDLEQYTPKQIAKISSIQIFDFDIYALSQNPKCSIEYTQTVLLFHYYNRNEKNNHAMFYKINL